MTFGSDRSRFVDMDLSGKRYGLKWSEFLSHHTYAVDISEGTQWRGTELTCTVFLCKSLHICTHNITSICTHNITSIKCYLHSLRYIHVPFTNI